MNPKVDIKVKKSTGFKGDLPNYESVGASGFDVRAQLDAPIRVKPFERVMVPTGLSFEIPPGFEIQVRARSGWASKLGMTVLNGPGTIDADYRGEVKVILINLGGELVEIRDQDRIAQFVVMPVPQAILTEAGDLSKTDRGAGGFGSTGF
ncbi:MAG: dUTP diphosphatase [Bdellovibrionia bacterium]